MTENTHQCNYGQLESNSSCTDPFEKENASCPTTKRTTHIDHQWMVLTRHSGSIGGLIDYGYGFIEDFFDTFKEADAYAQLKIEEMAGKHDPYVWVLRCERTYHADGVVNSKKKKQKLVR